MRWKYSKYVSSQQAQAEAKAVYSGVAKVLFDNGKHLHYKRFNQFDCIKQKNTSNGVKVLDWKIIEFMDHKYHIVPIPKTDYMQEVLNSTVLFADLKYAYLKRIEFESGYRYYVILTLSGTAPKKFQKCNYNNRTGVDFGTSSIATASNDELNLVELAPKSGTYEKQIRHLQNLVDHKTRIHNKDNYDEFGRVKKGHHKWNITKNCKKLKRKIRVLYRKQTAYVHDSHHAFINHLIQTTSEFILEPMEFDNLQKRSKKTERSDKVAKVKQKDGTVKEVRKYRRKKRFGHSIKNRSPGLMQANLKKKAIQYDIPYYEIDKTAFKASQLHHDTGEYVKPSLNERFKTIDGHLVQRDLYSAFLMYNTSDSLTIPDFNKCNANFPHFLELQDKLISQMKERGISFKQCFGFLHKRIHICIGLRR